jgi:hypothetical protein
MLRYRTNTGCQNADVGGIDLDVDAQLWALHKSAAEAAVAAGVMNMLFQLIVLLPMMLKLLLMLLLLYML